MTESSKEYKKDSFLIITRDKSIFNSSTPAGKFVADIGSIVSELYIIYIGSKQRPPENINGNIWVYTARHIPFFSYLSVRKVVLSQLVWKHSFQPKIIVSIGDEIKIAKKLSIRYRRPLYVFYSYMKVLGRGSITLGAMLAREPQKIFTPNAYIAKAIEDHRIYKRDKTDVKLLVEYIDVSNLEGIFESGHLEQEISSRNKIFTIIAFPRKANIHCFRFIKKMSKEILASVARFQFSIVVKPNQYLRARIIRYLFKLPVILHKEDKDSVNLLRTSRVMVYFETPTVAYEPVLYSFIAGCPVLSSGDEYSKIVLFNSGLEEYNHIQKDGRAFGLTVKKLINDPYTYTKYKMNCIGFAKTAFTHNRDEYLKELKDNLNALT